MTTDFLANLLDRALERAPVVQRRRPSQFEPLPDTIGLAAMPWGDPSRHGVEEPLAEMASPDIRSTPTIRLAPSEPRREGATFPALSMPEDTDVDSAPSQETISPLAPFGSETKQRANQGIAPPSLPEPALPKPLRAAVTPAEPATPQSVRNEPPLRAAVTPAEPVTPQPLTRELSPRLIETIIERKVEKPQPAIRPTSQDERTERPMGVASPHPPAAQPVVVPTIQRDQDQTREATASRRGLPQQHKVEAIVAKPPAPTGPPVQPVMRPPLPVVCSTPATGSEAPPAPTIQVTIGRIEVRATPPAATPTRAARPAAPKLSLEDYLRSRSRGTK